MYYRDSNDQNWLMTSSKSNNQLKINQKHQSILSIDLPFNSFSFLTINWPFDRSSLNNIILLVASFAGSKGCRQKAASSEDERITNMIRFTCRRWIIHQNKVR